MFHQAGRGQVYGILCARTSMWSRDPGPKFRRKVRLSFIYYLFLFLFFIFCFCDYFDVFLIVCLLSWFTYPPFLAYTLSSSLLPTHSVSLSLPLTPRYKGYFDKNFRHGTGVCSYRNKSKYAGEWYRGVPQGFGIYGTVEGDRYVGQWAAGEKT